MKIVHHDHTRRADRGELVGHGGRRVVDVAAVALQEHVGVVGHARPPRRDRREQPRHEACRLGIWRITRQPGHTITVFGGPHRKRRRLAVTGWCRHDRQPIVLVQARAETGSWHQRPARARNRQLGGRHHGQRAPSLPGQLRGLTRGTRASWTHVSDRPFPRSPTCNSRLGVIERQGPSVADAGDPGQAHRHRRRGPGPTVDARQVVETIIHDRDPLRGRSVRDLQRAELTVVLSGCRHRDQQVRSQFAHLRVPPRSGSSIAIEPAPINPTPPRAWGASAHLYDS